MKKLFASLLFLASPLFAGTHIMQGDNVTVSSVTATGANGIYSTYGISGGSLTIRNLASTILAVNGSGVVISTTVSGGSGLTAVFHRQYYPIGSGAVGNTSAGNGSINFPASFSGGHQTSDSPPGQLYSWAALAASADTFVILTDAFPSNVTGNIAVKVFAQPSSATGNASVLMVISGCIGDNGGTFLNGALPVYNSSQTVTNTWNGTANVRDITIASAMNTTGCTGGDRMLLKIGRQGTNGSDTYGSDVYIIGIKLEYSTTN